MIRQFTLSNALGATYSLMNANDGALFEPKGLGFDDVTEYEQVGEFFTQLTERFGQQVITGQVVFGTKPYEKYLTFTKFCQHSPLSLVYTTDAGTYQIPCRLTKIEKGDTDGWTYLNCPVEFTALARMYKTITANNTGSAGGGKAYDYKYDFIYGDFVADTVTIDSDSVTSSPCRISIYGECTQPRWRHYVDGNAVATGYYNGTIPQNHKLVIDTTSQPYTIEEQTLSGELIADRYELCDFSTERFFLLEYGHNTISVSHTDPDPIRLMVEGYIFYETI
jgi:hypothetical protein